MTAKTLTRRETLRALGASVLSVVPPTVLGRGGRQSPGSSLAGRRLPVALVPCPGYGPETLIAAVRAGWRSSRPPEVRGKSVLIKPNLVDVADDRPVFTDLRLVEALIAHLGDLGAREVIIAEGAAHNRDSEWLFRGSGYEAMAKRRGVRLVDLNYDDITVVPSVNPGSTLFKAMSLPRTVTSADVIISVPKMKTHRFAGVTLSMKNMFGVLPGIVYGWPKNALHWNGIPLSVCEINGTVKVHYSIVDGVVGMEGYGPLLGTAKKAGVLVMGDNALAVDATAARVMGVDPSRVEHLALAHRIRLGSLRAEDIEVVGEKIERVRSDFALEPEFAYLRAPGG